MMLQYDQENKWSLNNPIFRYLQLFLQEAESLKLQTMTKSNSSSLYKELSYRSNFFFFQKPYKYWLLEVSFNKKKNRQQLQVQRPSLNYMKFKNWNSSGSAHYIKFFFLYYPFHSTATGAKNDG